ncbi:ParB/RepB/Spo0J family partition protein [Isoptericola sp. 4D.3]|jgi:ParB family transcriptional regulator, chromosome partitioning protein|uniref:ParB/RepB/Spo0J family partition protein n=1 Tax=Isoptericola peretonis TaxID=2918523 RepID=A0ABT0J456_9MICO|nr:ParB/RepB/Spo0J family partition protein [Isoptericola sp. 4D.3]
MSQKKRGLGRGLGALIPSGPEGDRPVDVFFPSGEGRETPSGNGALATVGAERPAGDPGDDSARTSRRSASWDSAIAGGRLSIRTGGDTSTRDDGARSDAETPGGGGLLTDGAKASNAAPADIDEASAEEVLGADGLSLGLITSIEIPEVDTTTDAQTDALVSREGEGPLVRHDEHDGGRDAVSRETELRPVPGARFAEIPVQAIRPNTWQPRTVFDDGELDELVASISEIGVLQPVVVRPDGADQGLYELIMGERRWRASQLAGLETIPAIVRETDDSDMLRDALLENLHRAALNPLEEAAAYRQLLDDFGCTHEELATRIARSRPQISNTLRLLKLPPLVQRRVAAGVLSAGHARALLSLTDGAEIERLAQRIVSEGLSVRATEEIVTLLASGDGDQRTRRAPRAGQRSEAMDELATRLADRFETRVKVSVGKTKGRLTVEFASVEDLNRILGVMAPEDPGLLRS